MNWLTEYRKSLKNLHAEEPLDVYFFRPLAFIVVKIFYNTSITPNQYSLLAFLSGVFAGVNFIKGTDAGYRWGAFFFLLFAVLDCCDGMVARLKKNGSEFGRLIDGLVDYTVNAIVYITLAIGMSKTWSVSLVQPWILVLLAGLSKAVHSISYDHYLTEYLSYEKGDGGFVVREIENLQKKLIEEKNKKKYSLRSLGLTLYLAYSQLQAGKQERILRFNSELYCQKNLFALKLWSFIGPAVHILILILSFILANPNILFFYSIILGNVWLSVMFIYQFKINQEMIQKEIA